MLQDVLKNADPEEVRRYLDMAKMPPYDPDVLDMTRSIIEKGSSAYQAAQDRAKSGKTTLTAAALYYKSKNIVEDLLAYFGYKTETYLDQLLTDREAICPQELINKVRESCKEMGWITEERVYIRITGEVSRE